MTTENSYSQMRFDLFYAHAMSGLLGRLSPMYVAEMLDGKCELSDKNIDNLVRTARSVAESMEFSYSPMKTTDTPTKHWSGPAIPSTNRTTP